jgi:glycosyltransferase involved in cell wall biosynthesis
MTKPIDVLIVTPVYAVNKLRERYLLESLQSVKQQIGTGQHSQDLNIAHIIVDDGSSQGIASRIDSLASENRHILHQSNQGQSSANNAGIAFGLTLYEPKYIAIHHSDDIMLEDTLRKRFAFAQKAQADFLYSDWASFHTKHPYLRQRVAPQFTTAQNMYEALWEKNVIVCVGSLITPQLFSRIGKYDTQIRSAEDWDFVLRIAQNAVAEKTTIVPYHDYSCAYRFHDTNLHKEMTRNGQKMQAYEKILAKHFRETELSRRLDAKKDGLTKLQKIQQLEPLRKFGHKFGSLRICKSYTYSRYLKSIFAKKDDELREILSS